MLNLKAENSKQAFDEWCVSYFIELILRVID